MYETKKERRATFERYAVDAFADHILKPEQTEGPVRMWLCHKPETGIYHFRVVAAPGMIAVYGDVGENILRAYDIDLVPWLRGSVKSPDYLISKIVGAEKRKEFIEGEVEPMFANMLECAGYDPALTDEDAEEQEEDSYIKEAHRIIEETKENRNPDYDSANGHNFCEAFHSAGGDSELLDCLFDYDSDTLWTLNCLKKFVELLDKQNENKHTPTV